MTDLAAAMSIMERELSSTRSEKLPQAGILAQELLEKRLNAHGYSRCTAVPGLWTHITRPISFTLVVDDFGIKYDGEEHAQSIMRYPLTGRGQNSLDSP